MKIKLCVKGRAKAPNEDPGGWVKTLFEVGKPASDIKQTITISPNQNVDLVQSWNGLNEWLFSKVAETEEEEIGGKVRRKASLTVLLDTVLDHVCDYCGHAWVVRGDRTNPKTYRNADFLPLLESLVGSDKDNQGKFADLEIFLDKCIFKFLKEKSWPHVITVLTSDQ